ncbi:MAG: OB-fold nucleic acid binding domain-containing protein [Rubripirellula sp.]
MHAVRLGLMTIRGLHSKIALKLTQERKTGGPYTSMEDLVKRTGLGKAPIAILADADAFGSLQVDRRAAVWQSLGQDHNPDQQPLFADLNEQEQTPDALVPMTPMEEVHADYDMTGLSLKAHPISFVRQELQKQGCVTSENLEDLRDGRHVRVAGLILLRQKPSTAKGIVFATMEDETGSINLVIFKAVWERFFRVARTSNAWLVDGRLENRQGVIHVVVGRITDLSEEVTGLSLSSRDFH